MNALDEWFTTQEAAQLAGYHVDYLRKKVKSGEILGRKWGNSWMVNKESLLKYLEKMKTQGERRGPKPER